jgi:hypothetical protein
VVLLFTGCGKLLSYKERGFDFSPFQLKNLFLFPLLVGGGRGRWEGG